MPEQEQRPNPEPEAAETPVRVRPRPNVVPAGKSGLRKRYEAVGYWILLAIVLLLVIWFLVSSATGGSNAR